MCAPTTLLPTLLLTLLTLLTGAEANYTSSVAPQNYTVGTLRCVRPAVDSSTIVTSEPVCVRAAERYAAEKVEDKEPIEAGESSNAELLEEILVGALAGEVDTAAGQVYFTAVFALGVLPLICCLGNSCWGGSHCCARVVCACLCPKCCSCCECRPSVKNPYSKVSKLWPLVLWAGTTAVAVIFAIVGIATGTGTIQSTYTRGACLIDTTRVRTTTFLDEFRTPVVGFKDAYIGISRNVETKIGSVDGINTAIAAVSAAYGDLSYVTNFVGSENVTFSPGMGCMALPALSLATELAMNETLDAGKDFRDTMNSTAEEVSNVLVGMRDDIAGAINEADTLIQDLKAQVDDALSSASDTLLAVAVQMEENPNQLSTVSFAIFGWIYIFTAFFALGFVFILLNSHHHEISLGQVHSNPRMEGHVLDVGHVGSCGARCSSCSWCCVFFFGAVSSGLAMVLLPVGVVYSDMCIVSHNLPLRLGDLMPETTPTCSNTDGTTKNVGKACVCGSVTCERQGASDAPVPAAPGEQGMFCLTDPEDKCQACSSFGCAYDRAQASNASSLSLQASEKTASEMMKDCWNGVGVYAALDLGARIPINTTSMFQGMDDVPEGGSLPDEEYQKLNRSVREDLVNCTADSRSRTLAKLLVVDARQRALEEAIAAYQRTLGAIELDSAVALESQLDKLRCIQCGFIKTTWEDTYNIMCDDALRGVLATGNSAVVIGTLAFFIGTAGLLALRRWGGLGPIKAHEHGDDGMQLVMTAKLEGCCGCVKHHRKPSKALENEHHDEDAGPPAWAFASKKELAPAQYEMTAQEVDATYVAREGGDDESTRHAALREEQTGNAEVEGELI